MDFLSLFKKMMKKIMFTVSIMMPLVSYADKSFEINKANCNLPMKTIKTLLPKKADQEKAIKACMEKVAKEKWHRKNTQ